MQLAYFAMMYPCIQDLCYCASVSVIYDCCISVAMRHVATIIVLGCSWPSRVRSLVSREENSSWFDKHGDLPNNIWLVQSFSLCQGSLCGFRCCAVCCDVLKAGR
jgi:hypothetical protein